MENTETIQVAGHNFRIERVNEVALHFDRADIELSRDALVIKDPDDGSLLAIYNPLAWEAVIFRDA